MDSIFLYDNEKEKGQHLHAIQMLAMNFGISEDAISELYETELIKLKQNARIRDFLMVLAYRRVMEIASKMIARGEFASH